MNDTTTNEQLRDILRTTKTIALVGVSTNKVRASYFVARYLYYRNYRIIPVNPVYAGQEMFGHPIVASLSDIPKDVTVDMIDIFRKPEAVPGIVDEALEHLEGLKTVWMQFGISHEEAAAKARAHGLNVVENRCPKIEYQRLFGELRKAGINTQMISSKVPVFQP